MAWDSSRPVDWNRLVREWLIYAGIMLVVFFLLFRDRPMTGVVGGVLLSFPLYLGLGWVLAKFGLQRDRRRGPRSNDAASTASTARTSDPNAPRSKPAPTKRTAAGTSNRPKSATKRRR